MDKKALLADLDRLISHPDTPESERENALNRVREIEVRLSKAMVANKKKPGLASLSGHSTRAARPPMEKWPFGWDGERRRIDYQYTAIGNGGSLVWGCPDCGCRVTEDIRGMLLRRLLGKPDGVRGRINGRANGKLNQLCNACWYKHEG